MDMLTYYGHIKEPKKNVDFGLFNHELFISFSAMFHI